MSANAQMTAKGDAMYYVHSFLCLLIMFGFGQLPPVEPLTALGMRLIGIFLGLLYGWILSTSSGRAWPDCLRSCWWAA